MTSYNELLMLWNLHARTKEPLSFTSTTEHPLINKKVMLDCSQCKMEIKDKFGIINKNICKNSVFLCKKCENGYSYKPRVQTEITQRFAYLLGFIWQHSQPHDDSCIVLINQIPNKIQKRLFSLLDSLCLKFELKTVKTLHISLPKWVHYYHVKPVSIPVNLKNIWLMGIIDSCCHTFNDRLYFCMKKDIPETIIKGGIKRNTVMTKQEYLPLLNMIWEPITYSCNNIITSLLFKDTFYNYGDEEIKRVSWENGIWNISLDPKKFDTHPKLDIVKYDMSHLKIPIDYTIKFINNITIIEQGWIVLDGSGDDNEKSLYIISVADECKLPTNIDFKFEKINRLYLNK